MGDQIGLCLYIIVLSYGCLGQLLKQQHFNKESIWKSRNIYDKVSLDLTEEVLSIVGGKVGNGNNISSTEKQKSTNSLIYNRVNKCGSTSLLRLVEDLGFQNGYLVISRGLPKVRSLHESQKSALGNVLCNPRTPPMVLSRHLNFVDLGKYGCHIMYLNQVQTLLYKRSDLQILKRASTRIMGFADILKFVCQRCFP